jgi:hypothetical protein
MSSEATETTVEVTVERERPGASSATASDTNPWWLRLGDRLIAPRTTPTVDDPPNKRSANRETTLTVDPALEIDARRLNPIRRSRPVVFGQKGFAPIYQWEGVVEEVNGGGFRARLRPLTAPQEGGRVEYADFEYIDLSNASDHELVARGAVFYWTVGRSRNPAGTITNTSLLRFRRLPPPTLTQQREAAREAAALLADLSEDQ